MKKYNFSFLLIFILNGFIFSQTTLHVPAQYLTIQEALNTAQSGDTVLVQPGTYYENIFWPNTEGIKLVGVQSEAIIDGSMLYPCITINNIVNTESLTEIIGFIIRNGKASYGGGVFMNNSVVKFTTCTIENNEATINGGGLYLKNNSNLIIENSSLVSNVSSAIDFGNGGGAIYSDKSKAVINNCIINLNYSTQHGGGIFLLECTDFFLSNTTLSNNTAVNWGGAVYSVFSHGPNIQFDNLIFNNNNAKWGGAMYLHDQSSFTISNAKFKENIAVSGGGALWIGGNSDPTIISTYIEYNSAGKGGGVYSQNSTELYFEEVTFRGNSAIDGGGYYSGNASKATIKNCYFINNEVSNAGGGIYFYHSNFVGNNIYIIENMSMNIGGGIYLNGSYLNEFNNIILYKNAAVEEGGGMYLDDANTQPSYNFVDFIMNSAKIGGAIRSINNGVPHENPIFNKSIFSKNYSDYPWSSIFSSDGAPKFINCNFVANGQAIINSDNSLILEASSNYWGDNSGPYNPIQNPQGMGDSTGMFVNVSPWLDIPNIETTPIPVQNLSILSYSDSTINISWDESILDDLDGYRVYFDTDSTSWQFNNSVDVGNINDHTLANLEIDNTYYIVVTCYDIDNNESWFSNVVSIFIGDPTIISNAKQDIVTFGLYQNFPNPFNPSTKIIYQIPEISFVTIKVFDVLGKEIATLVNGEKPAGNYEVKFDGTNLPSGIYFYQLRAGSFVQTKKMLMIK